MATADAPAPSPASVAEWATPAFDGHRLETELEFVQCLANPHYLNFLAQRGYFLDERFKNYLQYLRYWAQPPYSHMLRCVESRTGAPETASPTRLFYTWQVPAVPALS